MQSSNGCCKFSNSNNNYEEFQTSPFWEFIVEYLTNMKIKNRWFFLKGYFGKKNVICNEDKCVIENISSVQAFNYKINIILSL